MTRITVDEIYEEVVDGSYGFSYNALWGNLTRRCEERNLKSDTIEGYELRKQLFFEITERLLREKKLFFVSGIKEIDMHPIEEQMKNVKDSFPIYGSKDEYDDLENTGLWFWIKCPYVIAWISPTTGKYIWT